MSNSNGRLKSLTNFLKNSPKFTIGISLILLVLIMTMCAPLFTSYDPLHRFEGQYHEAPSAEHILGTTSLGRDVFTQALYGGRQSIIVGLMAAVITTILGMLVGISAGYLGGVYDSVVSTLTNIMMVIPTIVLLLIIASMMEGVSPFLISLIIGLTSWPWNSRVLRAQTMSISNRDFVRSAETLGESKFRILFIEIMPNMLSIISSAFVGTLIYSIMAHATLEFIGFGNPDSVTLGTILFNAQNSGAFRSGYFFEVSGAIGILVMIGMGLTLINFAIDEISNPKLKAQRIMKSYYKARKIELKRAGKKSAQGMEHYYEKRNRS